MMLGSCNDETANGAFNKMTERLLRFFNSPAVRNLSLEKKCTFLRQKGLKQDGNYVT